MASYQNHFCEPLKNNLFFLCLLFGLSTIIAQDKQLPPDLLQITKEKSNIQWMGFKDGTNIPPDQMAKRKKALGLSTKDQLIKKSSQTDDLGITKHLYQQEYNGIPVEWALFSIQEENNRSKTANGFLVRGLQLNTVPSITNQAALSNALDYVSAEEYLWEDQEQEALLKTIKNDQSATFYPIGKLLIANSLHLPNVDPVAYRLAYVFDIYCKSPAEAFRVYVSGEDGALIKKVPLHRNCEAGQGLTLYNGNQNIDTELQANGKYRLFDDCRGQGVHTLSNNGFVVSEVYNNNNNWTNKRPYVSAHWASEETYDYYLGEHNRNSYDDNGGLMCSIVGGFCDNAFWNGVYTSYGRGCALAHNYLVGVDVVGHEWTHAVTQYSAGLVYAYEPGALNESFSDIFGTLIEDYAENGGGDYLLGEDFWIADGKLRDLSNPKSKQQPDTYCGQFWYTGQGDNGGVHINSGVQNYWFYILAEGDAGINDNGHAYDITGIGADKAAKIAYRNLTVYLGPFSGYQAAADGSVQAAADLYGDGSVEYITTIEAWCAVGVNPTILGGTPLPPQKQLNLVGIFRNGVCPNGANDGELAVQGVGGYPGYLYQFNDPNTGWQNSSGYEGGLTAGTYTFRVFDSNGGTAYVSLTLVEEDLINPVAVCKFTHTVYLDNNGQATVDVEDIDAGSSDNCGIKDKALSSTNFNCKQVDKEVGITLRVRDFANNTDQCVSRVLVLDNIKPVALCVPTYSTYVGNTILPNEIDNGSYDNCYIKKREVSPNVFNLPGVYTVTLTVTDQSGNYGTCTTEVTVYCKGGYSPGDPCDDYDTCTDNDIIQYNCECAGTPTICPYPLDCYYGECKCGPDSYVGDPCDDYDACTEGDVIQSDCSCAGIPKTCPTGQSCNYGNCECTGGPHGTPCDDGDPCTTDDYIQSDCSCQGFQKDCEYYCDNGNCYCPGGFHVGDSCDDYDPCTINDKIGDNCSCAGEPKCPDEPCDEGVCGSCPVGDFCDDGDACTNNDQLNSNCDCVGTPVTCPQGETCENGTCGGCEVGATCDDGDDCTNNDQLQSDCSCSGSPILCPGGETCVDGECGGCYEGDSCDDGDACTNNDMVQSDCSCAGTPVTCPDGETCENGICSGCSVGSSCDDGDDCTYGDSVQPDCSCGGNPVFCPAGETCVNGECGGCYDGGSCDDGDACTTNDKLNTDCECVGTAISCPPGETCVDGTCGGCEVGASCDDGDPCTNGDELQADCSCSGNPITCPPGESCEDGLCTGCEVGASCDDGDACTENDAVGQDCACAGTPMLCPPGESCDDGICSGCTVGDSCDDGNACTEGDTIQEDCSCGGSPMDCPPGEACEEGICVICVSFTTCDDGDPCTTNDTMGPDCLCAGVQLACPPGETCVDGTCEGGSGCTVGESCDDGNDCTENDTIQSDCSCSGSTIGCPPGQACDNGICVICTTFTACDDGDPCTTNDTAGPDCLCAGVALICAEGETCVDGTCESDSGCTVGDSCDDGDDCTENDSLQSDCSCAGSAVACPPGESCNGGTCTADCGGGNVPGDPCDDGNPGTYGDTYESNCLCIGIEIIGNPIWGESTPKLNVSPNPFNGNLTIDYESYSETSIKIELVDILRRIVYEKDDVALKGVNMMHLIFNERIAKGVYLLSVKDGEGNVSMVKVVRY